MQFPLSSSGVQNATNGCVAAPAPGVGGAATCADAGGDADDSGSFGIATVCIVAFCVLATLTLFFCRRKIWSYVSQATPAGRRRQRKGGEEEDTEEEEEEESDFRTGKAEAATAGPAMARRRSPRGEGDGRDPSHPNHREEYGAVRGRGDIFAFQRAQQRQAEEEAAYLAAVAYKEQMDAAAAFAARKGKGKGKSFVTAEGGGVRAREHQQYHQRERRKTVTYQDEVEAQDTHGGEEEDQDVSYAAEGGQPQFFSEDPNYLEV